MTKDEKAVALFAIAAEPGPTESSSNIVIRSSARSGLPLDGNDAKALEHLLWETEEDLYFLFTACMGLTYPDNVLRGPLIDGPELDNLNAALGRIGEKIGQLGRDGGLLPLRANMRKDGLTRQCMPPIEVVNKPEGK
jgi:hypothetical protein